MYLGLSLEKQHAQLCMTLLQPRVLRTPAHDYSCPGGSSGKESTCQYRSLRRFRLIPRLGRSLEEGKGNPLQYSCLENPMDRGAWWAKVSEVTLEEQAWFISQENFHAVHVTDRIHLKLPMVQWDGSCKYWPQPYPWSHILQEDLLAMGELCLSPGDTTLRW